MKRFAACLAIALLPLLAACSGGGTGGGGSGAGPAGGSSGSSSGGSGNPQPQQDLASIRTPPQPWSFPATTLTASDGKGNTYSLSISNVAPSGTVIFNGHTADKVVLALGLSENGAVIFLQDATLYYATNPFQPLGLAGSIDTVPYTALVTSFTPFPATLTVGSSGSILSATYYDPSGDIIGELSETYTVTADSPTALFVNIDAAGTFNGTAIGQTITYALSDTGSTQPVLVDVQLTVNGTTLTFH